MPKGTGVFRSGLVSELNGLVSNLELDKGGKYHMDLSLFSCPVTITAVRIIKGDQKVSVHLTITVQKTRKNTVF